MLAHTARRNARGVGRLPTALACLSATIFSTSCDKVPLLAPTGSVITLFATATTVPSNGSMEIVATVIEQGQATNADDAHDTDVQLVAGRWHACPQRYCRHIYDDHRANRAGRGADE
jgi:hypothetical protein